MTQERLLRFVVTDEEKNKTELNVEQRDGGRYFLVLRWTDEGPPCFREIEMTPGLLQELRRTVGKIA